MADLTIREIYDRHRNGDANSTADLIRAAEHFEEMAWLAMQAGPVFRLAANEAGQVASAMRGFIEARSRDFCDGNCTWLDHHADCPRGSALGK